MSFASAAIRSRSGDENEVKGVALILTSLLRRSYCPSTFSLISSFWSRAHAALASASLSPHHAARSRGSTGPYPCKYRHPIQDRHSYISSTLPLARFSQRASHPMHDGRLRVRKRPWTEPRSLPHHKLSTLRGVRNSDDFQAGSSDLLYFTVSGRNTSVYGDRRAKSPVWQTGTSIQFSSG